MKSAYFTGDETNGYEPYCGILSVMDGTARAMGHLFSASILNGGPGLAFLAPWVFEFIVGGMHNALAVCPKAVDESSSMKCFFNKVCKKIIYENDIYM